MFPKQISKHPRNNQECLCSLTGTTEGEHRFLMRPKTEGSEPALIKTMSKQSTAILHIV